MNAHHKSHIATDHISKPLESAEEIMRHPGNTVPADYVTNLLLLSIARSLAKKEKRHD